jgi:Zn2+/Cd2+-exporting ATPase
MRIDAWDFRTLAHCQQCRFRYDLLVMQENEMQDHDFGGWKLLFGSALFCGFCLLLGILLQRQGGLSFSCVLLYLLAYAAGGWDAFVDVIQMFRRGKVDIHFLMLFVAVGAACIGAWWEGAVLLFLFSLSQALEAFAMSRTERGIRALFHAAPKTALRVCDDGVMRDVSVVSLLRGDVLRILPGEQFPVDAVILRGQTAADEAMLTGESLPVEKTEGQEVFGGTLNTWGTVEVEVLRIAVESANAKIIRMIREAQSSKAPSQKFTDRFGTSYTVAVVLFCTLAFAWWHWGKGLPAWGGGGENPSALYKAMTLLVVCSPCALVISIPSAILAGIAAGAKKGILFRGGIALENLAGIQRIAMDKTGTLTKGEFEMVCWQSSNPESKEKLFAAAAALSVYSTHPLARAIVAAWKKKYPDHPTAEVSDLTSVVGQGLHAMISGVAVRQGRRSFFSDHLWLQNLPAPEFGCTEVIVALGDDCGRVTLRDTPRSESASMIAIMKSYGMKVSMLTGDREESARILAKELGLDDVAAGMTPEDKVSAIRRWQSQGERVAMVGDGVNDAPSLVTADVAIAMGMGGSDAALEQADVVLVKDRLDNVVSAFLLSRKCHAIIRQNIAISLAVLILLACGALGLSLPLPLGVMFHEGSTLVVVLNSLRLLLVKDDEII